jgi:hypothetical protein
MKHALPKRRYPVMSVRSITGTSARCLHDAEQSGLLRGLTEPSCVVNTFLVSASSLILEIV